jgi:hypothetical protein
VLSQHHPGREASPALVVSSMQNNRFASFTNTTVSAPQVEFTNQTYHGAGEFTWISLSPWVPTEQDFLGQSIHEGHCCIIANAAGLSDWNDDGGISNGTPVGVVITDNNQLQSAIDVCTNLYQGQRNIAIVPAPTGGQIRPGFAFLSGSPKKRSPSRTTIAVTAIDQGGLVDPVLLKTLSSGPYAGLPLKPASLPPKSLQLTRHEHKWNSWLAKIIHEAEEIIEEVLGLETHPFGGGHQLHLSLSPQGVQPLRVTVELDSAEPPGTVHSLNITQTDAGGARGGIRVGIVVT